MKILSLFPILFIFTLFETQNTHLDLINPQKTKTNNCLLDELEFNLNDSIIFKHQAIYRDFENSNYNLDILRIEYSNHKNPIISRIFRKNKTFIYEKNTFGTFGMCVRKENLIQKLINISNIQFGSYAFFCENEDSNFKPVFLFIKINSNLIFQIITSKSSLDKIKDTDLKLIPTLIEVFDELEK